MGCLRELADGECFTVLSGKAHANADGASPALLDEAGLDMGEPRGIGFSPAKGLHLSGDLSLNYIVTARAR